MLIGAHVREADPVASAAQRGAEVVQMFLADPQGWKKPPAHPQAAELREGPLTVVVHAPYVVNLASPNNRIRIPSRKLVAQHAVGAAEVGAIGLVVHGGHVTAKDDPADGVENWRKFLARQADEGGFPVPVLIENTAGGDTRWPGGSTRWPASGTRSPSSTSASASTPATPTPRARSWPTPSTGSRRSPGRIDLVHLNDSRDEFGSARDRHANVGRRHDRARTSSWPSAPRPARPVVVETPAEGQAADIAFLRERLGS